MIAKLTMWLVLLIAFKMAAVLVVEQFYVDPRRDVKAREELCNAFKPNVVFIGTSRTLFGIDPALFDSLNHQRTRSYNFGIFSISPQTSIQVAERMLTDNSNVKNIYIELSALDYSTIALKPQEVVQDAVFRANAVANSNIDLYDRVNDFIQGLNTTLFEMLSISPQITIVKKIRNHNTDPVEGVPDLRDNGHQSTTSALSQTNDRILANQKATEQMLATQRIGTPNTYYISKINQLIADARSHGKNVIFFYPNNITEVEYKTLSKVAPFLPEENLIRLKEQHLNEYFNPENLFDAHHLNQKGAGIYTRFLQEESLKRVDHL